jgi:hypothetical protein
MKRFVVLLATIIALPAFASTFTYSYTGPFYTGASSFIANHSTCTIGVCADYTASMRVTGSFTLAAPLAAGLVNSNITPLTYSFNDGINTIASSDPNAFIGGIQISTDGTGAITAWFVSVSQWTTGTPGAHVAGDRLNMIISDNPVQDVGTNNTSCLNVLVNQHCNGVHNDSNTSEGGIDVVGAWTFSFVTSAAPTAVPTLSAWGASLLSVLLIVFGMFGMWRRRSK